MNSVELHRWARPEILAGLSTNGLLAEPVSVAQAAQAVGWLESRYGTAWKGAGVGSHNWGCIQGGRPPCSAMSFLYTDSSPNADGTSTPYSICFKKYASATLGAADLVAVALSKRPKVLAAARRADWYGVSAELYNSRYYEGFGSTPAIRIGNHHKALWGSVRALAAALQEPVRIGEDLGTAPWHDDFLPDNPLIMRGSRGPYVKTWQQILGDLAQDGMFGPLTVSATIKWQKAHGLKPDGKVGIMTWTKADRLAA